MEDFKIIKIPEQTEEEEQQQEPILKRREPEDDYTPPKKRYIFLIILLILSIVAVIVIKIISTYDDYEEIKTWERVDAGESTYSSFQGNVLKYSGDGIFYTSYDGSLIWNYTYDMTNPAIDTCGSYIIAYDKKGSEVDIFSTKGFVNQISTNIPVVDARVAAQGTVALLLQENNTSYIQMYDKAGTLLVSGEIHPENRGFPVSMALSSDATKLLLSIINVNGGDITSELVFYDFTDKGKEEVDNIVATYTYIGTLIPKIEFVSKDKAIAFADKKIIVFNNNLRATVAKEINVSEEMKSIFYNDTHFGYVCEKAVEDGTVVNQLNVYNLYGLKTTTKEITESYTEISLMDNSEILISDGNTITICNLQGFEKFKYTFDEKIYSVIPGVTSRRYYLIEESKTAEIGLK
ncbi:DUF5711 family protein [Pseudobutyrivibrio xylanivorans]|uniref:PQQ-like domain-containing protein n=1 Tax=Pseudobutyrivibrio xylanivorans DSM 14809 TaxID=1123012 RepID=A0A1M6IVT4_PSEXY|nr:DUF5711 family protein [Pseudobutyrivibrio xylanivorans]SHJ38575.1 hypothetical protein SAMN02745725_02439 [Pseudobutyrivibrio xylanivorans DSM 14809]